MVEFLKVRDLENQIAEERKTKLKQESRSLVAEKTIKRTSLIPLERPPLRRINNSLPPPPERRPSSCSSSLQGKENNVRTNLMTRRRVSIAARPPAAPSQAQPLQPRRRVSLATLKPETTSSSQLTNGSNDHQLMVRNQRKARYSRLFTPITTSAIETTPTLDKSSSSRFDGSPTQAADSRMMAKHPHPAVIALQRKSLVWSPLKRRGIESSGKASLLPSRPSTQMR